METKLEREVRFLKTYATVATILRVVFVLTAFTLQSHKQRFEEIDVERINVVEKDGQVKMAISNKERLPGPGNIDNDKFGTRTGPKTPAILFYNEKGEECGGLIFGSKQQDGKYRAGAGLLFDKYDGDQFLERFACDEFHGDVVDALTVVYVVDVDDVRMVERGGGLCLLDEAALPLGIGDPFRWQNLYGDEAIEMGVAGLVDYARPTCAELFRDAVMTECLADHGRHLFNCSHYRRTEAVSDSRIRSNDGAIEGRIRRTGCRFGSGSPPPPDFDCC